MPLDLKKKKMKNISLFFQKIKNSLMNLLRKNREATITCFMLVSAFCFYVGLYRLAVSAFLVSFFFLMENTILHKKYQEFMEKMARDRAVYQYHVEKDFYYTDKLIKFTIVLSIFLPILSAGIAANSASDKDPIQGLFYFFLWAEDIAPLFPTLYVGALLAYLVFSLYIINYCNLPHEAPKVATLVKSLQVAAGLGLGMGLYDNVIPAPNAYNVIGTYVKVVPYPFSTGIVTETIKDCNLKGQLELLLRKEGAKYHPSMIRVPGTHVINPAAVDVLIRNYPGFFENLDIVTKVLMGYEVPVNPGTRFIDTINIIPRKMGPGAAAAVDSYRAGTFKQAAEIESVLEQLAEVSKNAGKTP